MDSYHDEEVEHFISRFDDTKETFLHGCCFWFAQLLRDRFNNRGYTVEIVHEPVENHFVAEFYKYMDGRFSCRPRYSDVRGDVTEIYEHRNLEYVKCLSESDSSYYRNLMRDCRDFLPEREGVNTDA